jgi:hypothetical protein
MSFRTGLLIAALIFVVTLIIRLPARLLVSSLPKDISCEDPGGTLWQGSCARVQSNGIVISGLSWALHPLSLLHGVLSADLSSSDPNNGGTGSVEAHRNGDLSITNLQATLLFPPGSNVLPSGTSATLTLALSALKIHDSRPIAIVGTMDLQQLHLAHPPADLGTYELVFPATESSTMTGQLRDLQAPLAVNGQFVLQPTGTYEIDGTVAARGDLDENINQALQFLGPPNPQGQRAFSLAGSL